MFSSENYELRVVNRGLLWVLRFCRGFQYVYLFHEPMHGLLLLKPMGGFVKQIHMLKPTAKTQNP